MIKIRKNKSLSSGKRYTEVDCQWLIPGYLGPSDAFDNYSIYFVTKNTLPTVCEWETLTYAHKAFVLEYGEDSRYVSYENIAEKRITTREEILKIKNHETHIKKVVYSTQKFVPAMIVDEPDVDAQPEVPI